MSDMKEEVESHYSVATLKETTPLSKTGNFVFSNEQFEADPDQNDNQPQMSIGDRMSIDEQLSGDEEPAIPNGGGQY